MKGSPPLGPIVGESPAIRRAKELIERYAPTTLTILIVGATGTGKELVARHIHARSGRRGRFVPVNCGALPREMAEGLLFGYERGAFSGAVKRHRGHIECADGGTLFLDELLSLPLEGQPKLLRVLDTGEIQRLGEEAERYVDVRVVGAVQEDVEERIARGEWRSDLRQRLASVVIDLPPLADRPEDIVPLAAHFAGQYLRQLEPEATQAIRDYDWPGNVREVRQAIERAGCLVENGTIPQWAIREGIALGRTRDRALGACGGGSFRLETRKTLDACARHDWDTRAAAVDLGIARSTVYFRLKAAGISSRACRKGALKSQ